MEGKGKNCVRGASTLCSTVHEHKREENPTLGGSLCPRPLASPKMDWPLGPGLIARQVHGQGGAYIDATGLKLAQTPHHPNRSSLTRVLGDPLETR